jgi:tRNA (adenine37-N6)-methyltransferase
MMVLSYCMSPIGIIHPTRSHAAGRVDVYPEFADGLRDIEGFSLIILLYVFHKSKGYSLRVKPFLDDKPHSLFSTRYPCRPNPLGISIVKLVSRQEKFLEIEGVDILDGTPLLDIKPCVPEFDPPGDVRTGWYTQRSKK